MNFHWKSFLASLNWLLLLGSAWEHSRMTIGPRRLPQSAQKPSVFYRPVSILSLFIESESAASGKCPFSRLS